MTALDEAPVADSFWRGVDLNALLRQVDALGMLGCDVTVTLTPPDDSPTLALSLYHRTDEDDGADDDDLAVAPMSGERGEDG